MVALQFLQPVTIALVPAAIFLAMVLVLIPSLLATSAPKPEAIVSAITCYMMKAFGLLLIGVSALILLYNLLYAFTAVMTAGTSNAVVLVDILKTTLLPGPVVSSLVFVLAVGIGILTHFNRALSVIDSASVAVPRAIFTNGCMALGCVLGVLSSITLVAGILVTSRIESWQLPASVLLLSILLTLSCSLHAPRHHHSFVSKVMVKKK